jgi:molybdopterin converting factor small subunit
VTVEVRLFATLARFLPPGSKAGTALLDLPDGATIADIARRLGIPPGLDRVVLLNGTDVEGDARLSDGDAIDVFPPLAGGRRPAPAER